MMQSTLANFKEAPSAKADKQTEIPEAKLTHHKLLGHIRELLTQGRQQVVTAVNAAMVQTYWQIGRLIVEDEQQGEARAAYGKGVLDALSRSLTKEFGKGFDVRNLRNMRSFYRTFPNRNAVRTELSWTHYRTLIRIENEQARQWYMKEAAEQSWSVRALERQMGTLYYERLLTTQQGKHDLRPVLEEAAEKTTALGDSPQDYLRDPYILDFLNLPSGSVQESELEQALINNLKKALMQQLLTGNRRVRVETNPTEQGESLWR